MSDDDSFEPFVVSDGSGDEPSFIDIPDTPQAGSGPIPGAAGMVAGTNVSGHHHLEYPTVWIEPQLPTKPQPGDIAVVSGAMTSPPTTVDKRIAIYDGAAWLSLSIDTGSSAVPIGSVMAFAGTAAPAGWLWCDGGAIPQEYEELARVLNSATTPNYNSGRYIKGSGTPGQEAGNNTISVDNLPAHGHDHEHGHSGIAWQPDPADHKHDLNAKAWHSRYAVYPNTQEAPEGAAAPSHATWGSGLSPESSAQFSGGAAKSGSHTHGVTVKDLFEGSWRTDDTGGGLAFEPEYVTMTYIIKAA